MSYLCADEQHASCASKYMRGRALQVQCSSSCLNQVAADASRTTLFWGGGNACEIGAYVRHVSDVI